jgi:quercetin dioxygenase-like cupin family protein
MESIDLKRLELIEAWPKSDPQRRVRFTFPISAETGSTRSSVAYAELPEGGTIPAHVDSANEVVLVLDGPVEFEIDGESESVPAGRLVQISSALKHRVTNHGVQTARLLFFFDEAADMVTFDEPLMPLDRTVLGGEH